MENTTPNTSNFLNWVEIKNFKSIKDLRLDCKRVNVFVGKPNVGKSNILEGLGLLGAEYSTFPYLKNLVRYQKLDELFYDNNIDNLLSVSTNQAKFVLKWHTKISGTEGQDTYYQSILGGDAIVETILKGFANERDIHPQEEAEMRMQNINRVFRNPETFSVIKPQYIVVDSKGKTIDGIRVFGRSPEGDETKYGIKRYDFLKLYEFKNSFNEYLYPPHGNNLFQIIDNHSGLRKELAELIKEYGLDLVLDKSRKEFEIQKREDAYVYKYSYASIADTFQRYIFYITAIESNKNSVIIFEEPEVHSFPPYTQEMAYRMIYDEDNQYFISTHSPYMLHPFIEKMDYKDLNVFITYYKDYQTYVRALTEEELTDILDYSTNVFFNLRKFEPNA